MSLLPKAQLFALRRLTATAVLASAAMGGTALAQEASIPMGTGADIATMCGDKPVIVGLVDGYGGDTWRKTVLAELRDEASACSNISEVLYADGAGDPAKTNSDINSMVALGVNVLIVFPDFGPAMFPAFRSAMEAGVVVVPYDTQMEGRTGVDYSFNVYHDVSATAGKWSEWLAANLKEGNVLYLSGPAGNAFSAKFLAEIESAFAEHPGLKLLEDSWVATNWNPAEAQRALTGAIAQHGDGIDAILTDFGGVGVAVVRTYEQAGLPMPYLASFASNNELNCFYMESKTSDEPWKYLALDGTTTTVRNALRRGLAEFQGTENPDPLAITSVVYADSFAGVDPKCDATMPPDADLSGLLSTDKLRAVFAQ